MMTVRRCDGCAYWELRKEAPPEGVCHYEAVAPDAWTPSDWWCRHWWPNLWPLPEPWEVQEQEGHLRDVWVNYFERQVVKAVWEERVRSLR